MHERLLVVAHGTASPAGLAAIADLHAAVTAARPSVPVELCYLDVASPRLPEALDGLDAHPTVVVPMLLSTGYHVLTDIPAALAGHPHARVARHLGPHPLLVDALVDRLPADSHARTVLAASGSSRAEAAAELATTADLLARRVGGSVEIVTLGRGLRERVAALQAPFRVATYLLAPGAFLDALRDAIDDAVGDTDRVAPPIGAHPSVVDLVWQRYDAVAGTR